MSETFQDILAENISKKKIGFPLLLMNILFVKPLSLSDGGFPHSGACRFPFFALGCHRDLGERPTLCRSFLEQPTLWLCGFKHIR